MKLIELTYKAFRKGWSEIELRMDAMRTRFLFSIHSVDFQPDFVSKGTPQIHVGKGACLSIGNRFRMNSGIKYNRIGRQGPCQLIVSDKASLTIGNDVGMSSSAIICKHRIIIGNRVLLGGNVVIYDTDFHSLDAELRADSSRDEVNRSDKPVRIADDVFIGAHSTILKGVSIGNGSIVGACSVVTKSIPENEIWAGNPAKFIRKVDQNIQIKVA